jgi:hypothetical protein
MHIRPVAALIIPLILLGCGGHTTPASPTPPTVVVNLVPGSYLLTLTMSKQGDPICNGGFCTSVGLCIALGAPPPVSTLATVVSLDRSGDAVTIRPQDPSATFRLDLSIAGTALAGTASGQFRDGALQISVAPGAGQSAGVATGTMLAGSVAGRIDGQVSIGGYSCSNNGHMWTLTQR